MVSGVLHGFKPQLSAEARACEQRAIADRRDVWIRRQQLLVDDDSGRDRQADLISQFDIGQDPDADNTIVVVPGANATVDADDVAAISLTEDDVAVSQFEIPLPAISAFFERARTAGATTILNPAPAIEAEHELLDLVDVLILNESELGFLVQTEFRDTDDPAPFLEAVRSLHTKDKTICVTLGKRGVVALIDGNPLIIPGHIVKAVDTTGAGDCFVGAVAAQLAGGKSIQNALDYANSAASICVQRMGAAPSMPMAMEVETTFSACRPPKAGTHSHRRQL